jgi:hypothetical protein
MSVHDSTVTRPVAVSIVSLVELCFHHSNCNLTNITRSYCLDCISTVWIVSLLSGLYLYCLDCISTVWIVSLPSGLYLYRLDCISTVWIVSLLSGLYLYRLDCISTVWIVSLPSGLYLYRLDCISTVWIVILSFDRRTLLYYCSQNNNSYRWCCVAVLLSGVALLSTGLYLYYFCRTSIDWIISLLLLSHFYRLDYISTTSVALLLLESHFYHSTGDPTILLFSKIIMTTGGRVALPSLESHFYIWIISLLVVSQLYHLSCNSTV